MRCAHSLTMVGFLAAVPPPAFAQPLRLAKVPVASIPGSYPIAVAQPPGEARRLYVVGHGGPVWVVRDGVTLPTHFVDVPALGGGTTEAGFLGFAFHPAFRTNGFAFACYNGAGPNGITSIV